MPTRCIHSRSSLIPSLEMLPFIQCHQTRGLADCGGLSKPCFSASGDAWPKLLPDKHTETKATASNRITFRGVAIALLRRSVITKMLGFVKCSRDTLIAKTSRSIWWRRFAMTNTMKVKGQPRNGFSGEAAWILELL